MTTITTTLPGFPLVNQLAEPTSDGAADENARLNCVPASLAAGLTYLTGRAYNGDQLKDAVYQQGTTGPEDAGNYVAYCRAQGVALTSFASSDGAVLIAHIHEALERRGSPVVLTMPSQWGIAPSDPLHPSGWTHVGIACGAGPGALRVMNPWGGFWQDQDDAWWAPRLCFGVVWDMSKSAEATTMAGIPQGWTDDGATLKAPNGVPVVRGFRDTVLQGWDANNLPLEAERHYDALVDSNPGLGAGVGQQFKGSRLIWNPQIGVMTIVLGLGDDILALRAQLAAAKAAQAQQQSAPSPADPQTVADAQSWRALKAAWALLAAK